jgi:hypothetical protein
VRNAPANQKPRAHTKQARPHCPHCPSRHHLLPQDLELTLALPPVTASLVHLTGLTRLALHCSIGAPPVLLPSRAPPALQAWDWGPSPVNAAGLRCLSLSVYGQVHAAADAQWLAGCSALTYLEAAGACLAFPEAAAHLSALTRLRALRLAPAVATESGAAASAALGAAVFAAGRLTGLTFLALDFLWRSSPTCNSHPAEAPAAWAPHPGLLQLLTSLVRLESLELGAGLGVAPPQLSALSSLRALSSLTVRHGGPGGFCPGHGLAQLRVLSRLRQLRVVGPGRGLSTAAGAGGGLPHPAPATPEFSGAELATLLQRARMESVAWRGCPCISAQGLRALAAAAPTLLELDLSWCPSIDAATFARLRGLTLLTRERASCGVAPVVGSGACWPSGACPHAPPMPAPPLVPQASTSPAACASATRPWPRPRSTRRGSQCCARPGASASPTAASPCSARACTRACSTSRLALCRASATRG